MTATFAAHCTTHGYGAAHVQTSHGPRCIKCINERRREPTGPVLTFEPPHDFVFRCGYDQSDLPRRFGFYWQPARRAWVTDYFDKAAQLIQYATPAAREEIEARHAERGLTICR